MSPEQSRAARSLLEWSQLRLAAKANIGESKIRSFESGGRVPSTNNLAAIRAALEAAGVEFIAENGSGPGVRRRKEPDDLAIHQQAIYRRDAALEAWR